MTIRSRDWWLGSMLLLLLLLGGLAPGCNQDRCKADNALIELRVHLSGVDARQVTYLELESVVIASPAPGSAHPYHERRVGTVVWPQGGSAQVGFVIDPGQYVRSLRLRPEGQRQFEYKLTLRAYGGSPPRLLAEGRFAKTLSADQCYLEQQVTLVGEGICEGKIDGDPCIGTGDVPAVCTCLQPALGCGDTSSEGLACEASTCGDGYTDRSAGELCEPGSGVVACSEDCLPAPVDVVVSDTLDASFLSPCPTIKNNVGGDTLTRGLSELAYPISATRIQPQMSLLIADVDGDGADEMIVGFPEGYSPNDPLRRGKIYVRDWPMVGNVMLGDPGRTHATLVGGPAVRPYWLGAGLSAGDLNGDGARDLVVGAPLREEGAGAAFVVFGGTGATLAPSLPAPFVLTFDTAQDQGQYMALEGVPAQAVENSPDLLGSRVLTGDLDGDGVDDLIVAAPGYTRDASASGAVYVIPGGTPYWESSTLSIASLPALKILTDRPQSKLGAALAVGDVDGDGRRDLVIGSEASADPSSGPDDSRGGAYVLFGRADLFADLPRTVWVSGDEALPGDELVALVPSDESSPILGLGGAVTVCDLNRDGAGELVVTIGRPGSRISPSGVLVIRGEAVARVRGGGAPLDPATDAVQLSGSGVDDLGAVLHCADANGDSNLDLILGAPGHDSLLAGGAVLEDAGAVYVVLGSTRAGYWASPVLDLGAIFDAPDTPGLIPLLRVRGDQAGGRFGAALAVSRHLGLADLDRSAPFTYVAAPGWSDAPGDPERMYKGRIWGLYLPALLPCGDHTSCPAPVE